MGLSRNKVAVSEGAAGSPPFYGESNLLETQQAEIERETNKRREEVMHRLLFDFQGPLEKNLYLWGCSSVGRAPALQAGGHGFESHHLHQMNCESGSGDHKGRDTRNYMGS